MSDLVVIGEAILRTLHAEWAAARAARDWLTADRLRAEIESSRTASRAPICAALGRNA